MKIICFIIHGIGEQNQKFSLPLREGVVKQLRKLEGGDEAVSKLEFYDLYWANEGSDFQDNLYRSIYPGLYAKAGVVKRWLQLVKNLGPLRALTFRLIGDVFGYLGRFQQPIKQAVVRQMTTVLKEKQSAGEPVSLIIVGHSLGSVILHDLISGFLEYQHAAFAKLVGGMSVFSMGSPLSLFALVAETAEPKRFRRWTNFLHEKDPVAFPMAKRFPTVIDVELSGRVMNPVECHAMYWTSSEVHRQIAAEVQEHVKNARATTLAVEDLQGEVPQEVYQPCLGATRVGFSQYLSNFDKVPFEELLAGSKRIDLCFVYGGTWVAKHQQYLARALENPRKQVRVCLLSPESLFVPGIGHQFSGIGEAELRERINRTTQCLVGAYQAASSKTKTPAKLEIYHSLNGINHTFYRFDDLIYFVPRQMTSDKLAATPIPTIVFRKRPRRKDESDMFTWLMRDYELLLQQPREAVLVFGSQTKSPKQ